MENMIDLQESTVLGGRWRVGREFLRGGCGQIYDVTDVEDPSVQAVLKLEDRRKTTLNGDLAVLKKLNESAHGHRFTQLLAYGADPEYKYLVMEKLGNNLDRLTKFIKPCSFQTQIRVGMSLLGALKVIHDLGYLHRDVCPRNVAVGLANTRHDRQLVLIDFGVARKLEPSHKRVRPPFRGKDQFSSVNMMERTECERKDDIESLIYVMLYLMGDLPWSRRTDHDAILDLKKRNARKLFKGSHRCLPVLHGVIRRRTEPNERPDYQRLYEILAEGLQSLDCSFATPWDWELEENQENEFGGDGNRVRETAVVEPPFHAAFFAE